MQQQMLKQTFSDRRNKESIFTRLTNTFYIIWNDEKKALETRSDRVNRIQYLLNQVRIKKSKHCKK